MVKERIVQMRGKIKLELEIDFDKVFMYLENFENYDEATLEEKKAIAQRILQEVGVSIKGYVDNNIALGSEYENHRAGLYYDISNKFVE